MKIFHLFSSGLLCFSFGLAVKFPSKTFLDAIGAQDIEFLEDVDEQVELYSCHDLEYSQAVIRSAEVGFIDGLKYLADHTCALDLSSKYWVEAFYIAQENENMDIVRFLFKKNLIFFSQEEREEIIIKACNKKDIDLVRFFVLYYSTRVVDIACDYLEVPDRDAVIRRANAIEFAKEGNILSIPEDSLTDEFIAFVFHSSSFGFP